MIDQKSLPSAVDLEEKVLGRIMLVHGAYDLVASILIRECFTTYRTMKTFEIIKELYLENKEINISTVYDLSVKKQINLDVTWIAGLTSLVVSHYGIEAEAMILVEKFMARKTILEADSAIKNLFEGKDIFDVLESLNGALNGFSEHLIPDKPKTINDYLVEWEKKEVKKNGGLTGIETGFTDLNEMLGGWQPTDLIILAARPGMGKTSFVLKTLVEAAKSGKKTVFFSLEMAAEQITQKLISMESDVPLSNVKKKDLFPDEQPRYDKAIEDLKRHSILIDDNSALNIFKLKNKLNAIKKDFGLDFVVIDYLQLMTGKDNQNRNEELDYISRQLKSLAKEFKVPIIALSQLSRMVEQRASKIPMLSDLRESGGIEANADIVAFIYRESYYGIMQDEFGNSTANKAQLIIAKHRNGSCDTVNLGWAGEFTKFYDLKKQNVSEASFKPLTPNNEFSNLPF